MTNKSKGLGTMKGGRGNQGKKKVPLPKSKPKVTGADEALKVAKTVYQSSFQVPFYLMKGLIQGDKKALSKASTIMKKLKEQKGKWNKGTVKTNKVQKALKMVKAD
mgnify:CR=1 FL=1